MFRNIFQMKKFARNILKRNIEYTGSAINDRIITLGKNSPINFSPAREGVQMNIANDSFAIHPKALEQTAEKLNLFNNF